MPSEGVKGLFAGVFIGLVIASFLVWLTQENYWKRVTVIHGCAENVTQEDGTSSWAWKKETK